MKSPVLVVLVLVGGVVYAQPHPLELHSQPLRPLAPSYRDDTWSFFMSDAVNGVALLSGRSPVSGNELWRTDGTDQGTFLVADLVPGPADSDPQGFVVSDGLWYFFAGSPRQVWVSDGTTAGTRRLTFNLGTNTAVMAEAPRLVPISGGVAFAGCTVGGCNQNQVYVLRDGGLTALTSLAGLAADPQEVTAIGDTIAWSGPPNRALHLWRADAGDQPFVTGGGATMMGVTELKTTRLGLMCSANDLINNDEPWLTDGTPGGTHLVANISAVSNSSPSQFTDFNGLVYFRAVNSGFGTGELFVSDGGNATVAVDFPGTGANVQGLVAASDKLFFTAAGIGNRLYASTGSLSGTTALAPVAPVGTAFTGATLGPVFFFGHSSASGWELWRSDGTDAGTHQWVDVFPGPASGLSVANPITRSGQAIYFAAEEADLGEYELWVTDGGSARRLRASGPTSSNPSHFMSFGARVLFVATGDEGRQLFVTDGTDAGTRQRRTHPTLDSLPRRDLPWPHARDEQRACFEARDTNGLGLWCYAPTNDELVRVADGGVLSLSMAAGRLFATRASGVTVIPLDGGAPSSDVSVFPTGPLIALPAGKAVFPARAPDAGLLAALWVSDGTPGAAVPVRDPANPTATLGEPDELLEFAANAWFVTNGQLSSWNPVNGAFDVVSTDAGRVTPGARFLYFLEGPSLARASANGGVEVLAGGGARPAWLAPVEGGVVALSSTGADVWFAADTSFALTSFTPGARPGEVVTTLRNLAVFRAVTDAGGNELWVTDGTAELTVLLGDVVPGPVGSAPPWVTMAATAGSQVVFPAMSAAGDIEPWVVGIDDTPPLIVPTLVGRQSDAGTWISDVTVQFAVTDSQSPAIAMAGCTPSLLTVDGVHQLTCTGRSLGGFASATVTLVRDVTPPVPSCPSTVFAEASSDAGATLDLLSRVSSSDVIDPAPSLELRGEEGGVLPAGGVFPLGVTAVQLNTSDVSGNVAVPCTFRVEVRDTAFPVFACLKDLTVDAESSAGAVVTFEGTASDSVDGLVNLTTTPASGSLFSVGDTSVTVTAVDSSSNRNTTCPPFLVHVSPFVPPDSGAGGGGMSGRVTTCGCDSGAGVGGLVALTLLWLQRRRAG